MFLPFTKPFLFYSQRKSEISLTEFKWMAELLESLNLYTKLNQIISRSLISSCVRQQPQVLHFECLQNTHHHAHISLSVLISFSEGAQRLIFYKSLNFLLFQTSANIWKGDWLRLWSACLEPTRPFFDLRQNAVWLWAASEQGELRGS